MFRFVIARRGRVARPTVLNPHPAAMFVVEDAEKKVSVRIADHREAGAAYFVAERPLFARNEGFALSRYPFAAVNKIAGVNRIPENLEQRASVYRLSAMLAAILAGELSRHASARPQFLHQLVSRSLRVALEDLADPL